MLRGQVIKRKIVNGVLGFFQVLQEDSLEVQVRIKSTELCYIVKSEGGALEYTKNIGETQKVQKTEEPSVVTWKVNCIKVGSNILAWGYFEDTNRGTKRFVSEHIRIFPSSDDPARNLSTIPKNQSGICKKWAKQQFYTENKQNEEEKFKKLFIHWNTGCSLPLCPFNHSWATKEEKKSFFGTLERQGKQRIAEFDPNDPFHASDLISRTQRAQLFAEWIQERISSLGLLNLHIIDVAGGSGCLLRELLIRLYPMCESATLIEPNTRKATPESLLSTVRHRIGVDTSEKSPKLTFYNSFFDRDFFTNDEHQHLFTNPNTIIVGLHSDQATEPIVDCALFHNIHAAVVPCCVFADDFPDRVLRKDGENIAVRTYPQFIEFLEQKSSSIQSSYLPLQGRNRILYHLNE